MLKKKKIYHQLQIEPKIEKGAYDLHKTWWTEDFISHMCGNILSRYFNCTREEIKIITKNK